MYTELKFDIMLCVKCLVWFCFCFSAAVCVGEMPGFYLIGKIRFTVSRTELMPDGPSKRSRVFPAGRQNWYRRKYIPRGRFCGGTPWPVHTLVIFLFPVGESGQREEVL